MEMQGITLVAEDFPRIEAFLAKHSAATLQQDPAWATLQETLGVSTLRIGVADDQGDLLAYAQFFLHKLPFGLTWLHCPRGPLFLEWRWDTEQLFFMGIEKLAEASKAVFIRFDWPEAFQLPVVGCELRRAHTTNFPETTLMLDLTMSEEKLLARMKPKGRYNIHLAEKHGVKIRETTDPKVAKIFYDLLQKTTARDNFTGHSANYYQKFLQLLRVRNLASCFLAEKDGKPIAAILATFFGDPQTDVGQSIATYYYGASDHEYRALMAPYALQWAVIRAAKQRGFKRYDLLGITPEGSGKDHPLAGVTDFKKKFGGRVLNYSKSAEMVLRPVSYTLMRLAKKLRG